MRRTYSESGYYHVTVRTAGQIALFEDDEDRKVLVSLLKRAKDEHGVCILAWVFMTDHFHLVIDVGENAKAVSPFMHSVNRAYARYFNEKTNRTGALVQSKYWSKPIADDAQLIATVYYVHRNPEAVGMCPMRSWRWSSYREYAGMAEIADTGKILEMFGGFAAFDAYAGSTDNVVSRRTQRRYQDDDVLEHAIELAGVKSSSELRGLPRKRRNGIIVELYASGAAVRQIARTFGIGVGTVSRAIEGRSEQ